MDVDGYLDFNFSNESSVLNCKEIFVGFCLLQ